MKKRKLKLVLPTGRLYKTVLSLLADAGLVIANSGRDYRPLANDPAYEIKLIKAANIPKLIEFGAHDAGFSGLDWVRETRAEVETLLETGLLPVRIVAAAPIGTDPIRSVRGRPVVVASEYERLTREYMDRRNVEWRYVRTHGSTEVFPPEDADLIVDNTATGSALASNGLEVTDVLLNSTTLFMANARSLEYPQLKEMLDHLVLLMKSILDARQRVLLEMNVDERNFDAVLTLLPAMKAPTVQPLHGDGGYAVKAAVPREQIPSLIPTLCSAGATDILQTKIERVIV